MVYGCKMFVYNLAASFAGTRTDNRLGTLATVFIGPNRLSTLTMRHSIQVFFHLFVFLFLNGPVFSCISQNHIAKRHGCLIIDPQKERKREQNCVGIVLLDCTHSYGWSDEKISTKLKYF